MIMTLNRSRGPCPAARDRAVTGAGGRYRGDVVAEQLPEPLSTRDRLLDAAAVLFAERGVDRVSVAEVVRAAGQRNTSAVLYHIGNRSDLLYAVLARHVPAIATRRRALLDQVRADPAADLLQVTGVIVRPVAELARLGWRERAYLQIGSEISGTLDRSTPEIRALMRETVGYEAWDLLHERCPEVPADLWQLRCGLCIVFVGRAVADRARQLDEGGTPAQTSDDRFSDDQISDDRFSDDRFSDDRFVDNLTEMVLAAMTAPHRER